VGCLREDSRGGVPARVTRQSIDEDIYQNPS